MKLKGLFLLIGVFFTLFIKGQIPQSFSYQAVVRNSSNELVKNAPVHVRISIGYVAFLGMPPKLTFFSLYTETHQASTDENGLFTISIGNGSVIEGRFDTIPWTKYPLSIKTEIDPNNGNDYPISSISQILSVPYAINAQKAQNGILAYGNIDENGNILSGSGNYSVRYETSGIPLRYKYYISVNDKPFLSGDKIFLFAQPLNSNVDRYTYTLTEDKEILIEFFDDNNFQNPYLSSAFKFFILLPF